MPLHEFWLALSNTGRLNPYVGIPAIKFTPVPGPGGTTAYLNARARYLGVPVVWREMPFEWQEDDFFLVERQMTGLAGMFFGNLVSGARMRTVGENETQVEMFGTSDTRNPLGRLLYKLIVGKQFLGAISKACRTIEKNYHQLAEMAYTLPPPEKPQVNRRQLFALCASLRESNTTEEIVTLLRRHLASAPDDEVVLMRAFVLADKWQQPRKAVLRACLKASRLGLLDATWEVMCPNCRVSKGSFASLRDLKPTAHCDTCNIRYDVNFDQYVELRFTVSEAVRKTTDNTYCIGGPYVTPHIVAQSRITARAQAAVAINLPAGRYRLRLRQASGWLTLILAPDGQPTADLVLEGQPLGGELRLQPQSSLSLHNQGSEDVLLIIEQEAWENQATSAALVTALQEFRNLFSSEVLSPGTNIAVRNLTFLFTDLKNSTALYERVGDSPAYARVRDHFTLLTDAVAQHSGALVKTMGDAVMAVFSEAQGAVAAGLEIQAAINDFNTQHPQGEPLCVKVSLHSGPCLAVNANETLDYFGTTVNTAARLQALSQGGDMIVSGSVYADEQAYDLLTPYPTEQETTSLKGIALPIQFYRLDLSKIRKPSSELLVTGG